MDIAFGILCGAILVFLPGYLVSGFSRLPHTLRIACAPAISIGVYCVAATLYSKIGIPCSWLTLFLPFLVAGIVIAVVAAIVQRRSDTSNPCTLPDFVVYMDSRMSWITFAIYLICGLLLTAVVFLGNLDGLYEFSQRYDNVFHMGLIRTFLDTDAWSILNTSVYAGAADFEAPIDDIKFYPSAWHMICTMVIQITGVSVPYSENIVNMLFVSLVFPAGMFALMNILFPRNRAALLFGAITSFAFAAFPWKLMSWGPIFPNLAAMCAIPSIMATFMLMIGEDVPQRRRIWSGILFVFGCVGIALLQPNGIFTMAIFLGAYCFHRIGQSRPRRIGNINVSPHVMQALFVLLAILIWLGAYKAPFIHEIASFVWPAFSGKAEALRNIALLSFRETSPQLVLGIIVIAGFVLILLNKEKRWVVLPYLFMCVAYFIAATTDGRVKQVLSGFWYTDPIRLGANIALFAIPLASYALACAYDALRRLIDSKAQTSSSEISSSASNTPSHSWISYVLGVSFVAVFALTVFYPGIDIEGKGVSTSALGGISEAIEDCYSNGSVDDGTDNVYDEDERLFIQKVKETVEPDAVILNEPNDGSGFLYGAEGMNIFYRYMYEYDRDDETEESHIIRQKLNQIGTDQSVQQAVDNVSADYILILDQNDDFDNSKHLWSYEEAHWLGFDSISDATEGLELVLSDGDMRLYKVAK